MKALVPFYSFTLLVGAFLLFLVQPMVGKMLLPPLGGSAAVWTTCVLFFQAALLAGYSYSHLTMRWMTPRHQALLTLAVLLLPLFVLPIAANTDAPVYDSPLLWLLGQLTIGVGLPFFAVATGAPALQRWFHSSGHPAGNDPYFLYAASNTGSLLALVSYPLVVEPWLSLNTQTNWWAMAYRAWVVLVALCAVLLWRREPPPSIAKHRPDSVKTPPSRIASWIAWAFVPSSLMLGVTTYVTNDIAAVPLLWVVPLALYLLTFILVFSRRPLLTHALMLRLFPFAVVLMLLIGFGGRVPDAPLLLIVPLLGFFCVTMVCHGELYRRRPDASRLTEFYFWLSVGGVLGGLFNAVIAQQLFDGVAEYPIVLILACLLLADNAKRGSFTKSDVTLPLLLLASSVAVEFSSRTLGVVTSETVRIGLAATIALLSFSWQSRPLRFALATGVLAITGAVHDRLEKGNELWVERNFFGIKRVTRDSSAGMMALWHGNTLHGAQSTDNGRRMQPLTYYSQDGPLGDIFKSLDRSRHLRIGVIGLGAGALAAYGAAGDEFTFYEIDPSVGWLASEQGLFSFLADSPSQVRVIIGDGRLQIARAADSSFDVIVLDAFSSDSVPTHLLTAEAVAIYLSKLAPDGILAFHISSRYLGLRPLIGSLGSHLGLTVLARGAPSGNVFSVWAAAGRGPGPTTLLLAKQGWTQLSGGSNVRVWTDQYSNIVQLLHW